MCQLHDFSVTSQVPFIPVSSAAICGVAPRCRRGVIYSSASVNNENFCLSKGTILKVFMPQIMLTGATIIIGSRALESRMNHGIGSATRVPATGSTLFKLFRPDTSSSRSNYRSAPYSICN